MQKKLLLLITSFLLINSIAVLSQASWQPLFPEPTSNVLTAPYFVNEDLGWIVGDGGIILKTVDGGSNWEIQISPVSEFFTSCFFPNEDLGFITGFGGTILKTTNGGLTWVSKPSASHNWIMLTQFTNSAQGFALTTDSILKTTDGGETWQRINTGNSQLHLSMYFLNDSVGWIGCSGGKVIKTNDSGNTWTEINTGFLSVFFQWIKFFDNNIGYAGGADGNIPNYPGRILKTVDGGITWSLLYSNSEPFVFADFLNENAAYFVNDDYIVFVTHDEFNSINAVYNPQDSTGSYIQIYSAQFTTDSVGYIVGTDGLIAKTTNQFASWQKLNKSIGFFSNSMTAPDLLHIWATDAYLYNIVLRSSRDGGITWSYTVPDSGISCYYVCFTDTLHGWVSGLELGTLQPRIGITSDGGVSWTFISGGIDQPIWSMTFFDENHGWIGTINKIYRTIDGGYTWSFVTIDSALYIRNLDFTDDQEGWLVTSDQVGSYRLVKHTLDGGANWQTIFTESGTSGYFTEVDFINSNVGYMTGAFYPFRVLKTIDGGFTWTEMNFDPDIDSLLLTGYLGDLKVTSANKAWFCGSNYDFQAFIIGTNDGGTTWQLQLLKEGVDNVQSLCFVNDTVGWASASYGYFFKLNAATGIESFSDVTNNLLQLFPNPAFDNVQVKFTVDKPGDVEITVFDIAGRKLLCKQLGYLSKGTFRSEFSVDDLSGGIYQVTVNTGGKCNHQKLLKF